MTDAEPDHPIKFEHDEPHRPLITVLQGKMRIKTDQIWIGEHDLTATLESMQSVDPDAIFTVQINREP